MKLTTPSLMRMMLILSPCAALTSVDVKAAANMNGTPTDYQTLLDNKKTGVVMISRDSCPHCASAKPEFEAVANEITQTPGHENKEFIKLDSQENQALMTKHNLDGVPAFVYVKDGEVVKTDMGFEGKEKLKDTMSAHVSATLAPMNDEVSANVDAQAPVKSEDNEGILGKLKGLFIGLFEKIKDIFVSIFDWIKGLFNR